MKINKIETGENAMRKHKIKVGRQLQKYGYLK